MMFKNAIVYAITPGYRIDPELLRRRTARECGLSEARTTGFAVPCNHATDGLVHQVAGSQLICFQTEDRVLPGPVVAEELAKRAAKLEEVQGFHPGKKQMRELKERITEELLPKAFTTKKRTYALLTDKYFIVDASSASRAELVKSDLFRALDLFPISLLRTAQTPTAAMTEWLVSGTAPDGFSIDRDCELRSPVEEKASVRYAHHPLDTEEIGKHIAAGKQPTKLAMTWNDRISFVLTDAFEIKRVAYLDILQEEAKATSETAEEEFDASMTLMHGELTRMIDAVIDSMGGLNAPEHEGDLLSSVSDTQRKESAASVSEAGGAAEGDESTYKAAIAVVRNTGRASISTVQRHLQIGYNHAARLIERMEKEGVVSVPGAKGQREVLEAALF